MKNKNTATVLAILLGGLGVHKFYLGQILQGVLYLGFCWTLLPSLISLFEAFSYIQSTDVEFHIKYDEVKQDVNIIRDETVQMTYSDRFKRTNNCVTCGAINANHSCFCVNCGRKIS